MRKQSRKPDAACFVGRDYTLNSVFPEQSVPNIPTSAMDRIEITLPGRMTMLLEVTPAL
jgi:hypothetical protein